MAENLEGELLEGRFQLLELLATGGFSPVYKALDIRYNKPVAIKIARHSLSPKALEKFLRGERTLEEFLSLTKEIARFLREAETLAMLDHPHIIKILDRGAYKDRPFLVLSYAHNGSLGNLANRGPSGEKKIQLTVLTPIIKQIAEGLQHLHNNDLIHCDIKPENILLDDVNNAWLADFNTTTPMDSQFEGNAHKTGTPLYMAPEQSKGHPQAESDIYSLGITFYESASGKPPFTGDNKAQLQYQHEHEIARSLFEVTEGSVPVKISALVDRMMSKDPTKRPSAAALVSILDEYLKDNPAVTVDLPLPSSAMPSARPILGVAANAPSPIASPPPSSRYSVDGISSTLILVASLLVIVVLVTALLIPQLTLTTRPQIPIGPTTFSVLEHNAGVAAIWLSIQGFSYIASIMHEESNRDAIVISDANANVVATYLLPEDYNYGSSLAYSPSDRLLYAVSQQGHILIWPVSQAVETSPVNILPMPKAYLNVTNVASLAVAPNGNHLAIVSDNETKIWDSPLHIQGTREDNHDDHSDYVSDVVWSSDSRFIASASYDGTIHVFYRLEGSKIKTQVLKDSTQTKAVKVLKVAFFPDNIHLLAANSDRSLLVWNLKNQHFISYEPCVRGEKHIGTIAISHDGQKILVACDRDVYVFNWNGTSLSSTNIVYTGHSAPVNSLGVSANDKMAASASSDSTTRVWSIAL